MRGTHVEGCFVSVQIRMRLNSEVRNNVPCTLWILSCFARFLFSLKPELTSRLSVWFLCAWQPSNGTQTGLGRGEIIGLGPSQNCLLFLPELQLWFSRLQMVIMIVKKQALSLLMRIIKLNNSWAPTTYGAPYKTQIYPALSGNEVFHISEFSGKLGLPSLASIFFSEDINHVRWNYVSDM